jgi:signal transduction histidine kinase
VISLAALADRFRGASGDERLQLKWFVTASALVFIVLLAYVPSAPCNSCSPPLVFTALAGLAFLFLLLAIGIAVLKYRLYEIDVVISKTLLYGTLAISITLVYVGLVVGVGTLVGNTRSPLLAAIAAALIAVAFQPIRQRGGRLANRIVYGRRATPYEVLSDFAERMAGAYTVEDVLPHTARMLAEGTGAIRSDVWLLVGSELRAVGSWPPTGVKRIPLIANGSIEVPGALAVPVRYQGEVLGALSMQKPPGDPITSAERRLLDDVASQAGLVLRNARLIEELRASRQRIVSAQDAAARRLERNLHDGAQQQLVALAVKTRLADSLLGRDDTKAHEMLSQMESEMQDALENLRDLARGIYPPLLADQGLAVALEARPRGLRFLSPLKRSGSPGTAKRRRQPCTSASSRHSRTWPSTRVRLTRWSACTATMATSPSRSPTMGLASTRAPLPTGRVCKAWPTDLQASTGRWRSGQSPGRARPLWGWCLSRDYHRLCAGLGQADRPPEDGSTSASVVPMA